MDIFVIVALVVASLVGSGLLFLALQSGQKTREAQKKLAQDNGWTFAYERASGGGASKTLISDPAEGWLLTLYSYSGSTGESSGNVSRWTQFEHSGPAMASGMAVLGPALPEKTTAMANKMLGAAGGGLGGMLGDIMLRKMMGDFARDAVDMQSVPGPGAGSLFSTPGAETALDAVRDHPSLLAARQGRNEAQQPIVMRGSSGLRMRQTGLIKKPDQLQAFIQLGRSLAQDLSKA